MDPLKLDEIGDQHKHIEPSELWKKMALMRKLQERFQALQDDDDLGDNNNQKSEEVVTPSGRFVAPDTAKEKAPVSKATNRWTKIRKIVLSDKLNRLRGVRSANATPIQSPRLEASNTAEKDESESQKGSQEDANESNDSNDSKKPHENEMKDALELEDINLDEFWDKNEVKPFEIVEDIHKQIHRPEEKERVFEEFDSLVTPQALPVQRIPEEVVQEKKTAIEKAAIERHKAAINSVKKMQVDVICREDLARKRVKDMEKKARSNLLVEKAKVVKLTMDKEKELSHNFRKAREDLEAGIKRQEGAVKEHFGSISIHRDSLARKYQVYTQMFPQPVEFRIHMLRGVKNKLPKGAYALMLTQYDSLGGHPISWTHLDASGIGSARPGITRVAKHPGRYFDRVVRFEDSVFALCPPGPKLRPSFVFVLELFHLASHKNPTDEIVAWTALPMAFENMSLVEGKMRLPMIRGEHSPFYQHFRTMEQTIANDLSSWLCNIYFEVRHLSLQELGATEAMLKSVDYDLDYVSKSIVSGKELQKVLLSYEDAYQNSLYGTNHKLPNKLAKDGDVLSPRPHAEGLIPILPVDKGIFRRKLAHNHQIRDLEKGGSEGVNGGGGGDDDEEKKGSTHALDGSDSHPSNLMAQKSLMQQLSRFISGRGNSVSPGNAGSSPRNGQATSAFHGQSKMSKVENFAEHRQELIRKWKQNIRMKLSKFDNEDEEETGEVDLLERGYNLRDEEFLHPVQRGKLAGVEFSDDPSARAWGAAGLEGIVVRKWQSEGIRLDNDAVLPNNRLSPKSPITPASNLGTIDTDKHVFFPEGVSATGLHRNADGNFERDVQGWEELRDGRELSEYTMSIAYDPTRSKNLMPGAISRSKLRYMMLELFGDLFPLNYGTFDFYLSIFCYVFALWMRVYVHYLSQYLYILGVGTPLYDFHLGVLQIFFKYSSTSISDATEVAIVAIGMIGNIVMMLFLSFSGVLMYQMTDLMPDGFSKFFAAYGVVVVLDPYLITLIDLIYHNYGCTSVSEACRTAYTSADCDCFYGDFVKLYHRMLRDEGSGITGAFITFILFVSCSILSLFILYEYLVYIHRDGRILDLWRRITASADEFFIPDDLEVSRDELQLVLTKCRRWIGPAGARRKVAVEETIEKDPDHKNYLGKYTRYIIHEVEKDGSSVIHRQFFMDQTGKIVEIFEDHKSKLQQQNVFAVFNKNTAHAEDHAGDVINPDPEHSDDDDKDENGKGDKVDGDNGSENRRKSSELLRSLSQAINNGNNHSSSNSRRNSNQSGAAASSSASRRNSNSSSQLPLPSPGAHEGKESAARASSETEIQPSPTHTPPAQQPQHLPESSSIPNSARRGSNSGSIAQEQPQSSRSRTPRGGGGVGSGGGTSVVLDLDRLQDTEEDADAISPLHPRWRGGGPPGQLNRNGSSSNNDSNSGRIPLFDASASSSTNITPRQLLSFSG